MKRSLVILMAMLALLACASIASADTRTFYLTIGNDPNVPVEATPPYGEVNVVLGANDVSGHSTANVTFTTLAPLPLNQVTDANEAPTSYTFIATSAACVNVNATPFVVQPPIGPPHVIPGFTLTDIHAYNHAGVEQFDTIFPSSGGAGPFGNFNARIEVGNDAEPQDNDVITFLLTDLTGTWASAAEVLSPNTDGHFVMGHVIPDFAVTPPSGPGGPITFFVTDGPLAVPIPPSALLMGSGLLGLGATGWRRFQKS